MVFPNSFFLKCTLAVIVGVFFPLFLALSVLFLTLSGVKGWKRIEKGRKKRNRALNGSLQLKTTQANLSITLHAKFDYDEKTRTRKDRSSFLTSMR